MSLNYIYGKLIGKPIYLSVNVARWNNILVGNTRGFQVCSEAVTIWKLSLQMLNHKVTPKEVTVQPFRRKDVYRILCGKKKVKVTNLANSFMTEVPIIEEAVH